MKKLLSIAVLSTVFFTSCYKGRLKGEGSIISDTRSISSFYTLQSDGEADVEVIASNSNKVVVTGYQNLVPAFETNVSGDKLTLRFKEKYINVRNNNIKVTVYSTNVNMVRINGSGRIIVGDSIKSKTMMADINGSGDIGFGKNAFDDLNLHVSGSGNISAYPATSKTVTAEISGSGDIQTTVTETLNAKISGSGDIDYMGNPVNVNLNISGSGKVHKH
ncbi:MAG: DUF2807 domain-containing protein [Bacteroidetes bacterium]|nr:DUF2807 domain-containing protein [Bacteroidota bacterium]